MCDCGCVFCEKKTEQYIDFVALLSKNDRNSHDAVVVAAAVAAADRSEGCCHC